MLVLHANWSNGALRLWAESLEAFRSPPGPPSPSVEPPTPAIGHPFAADTENLRDALVEGGLISSHRLGPAATLSLDLPADATRPRPSDRLTGAAGFIDPSLDLATGVPGALSATATGLENFTVPCLTVHTDQALAAGSVLELGGPTPTIEYGHGLRYWLSVLRFVLELLVDQRFIPTLLHHRDGGLRAAWQPWLHDEAVRCRVGGLVTSMPPIARAVRDVHNAQPWPILADALHTLTDCAIRQILEQHNFAEAIEDRDRESDPHVAWLTGLLSGDNHVTALDGIGGDLLRDVGRWVCRLDETSEGQPFQLCLRLHEPPAAPVAEALQPVPEHLRWTLSVHLRSVGDPSVLVSAEQIWRQPGSVQPASREGVERLQELMLSELGRASRVYDKLEAALSGAAPSSIELTTAEAYEFLQTDRPVLEESGVAVIVPGWWEDPDSRLGARLHIDSQALRTDDGAAGAPGRFALETLVRCRWEIGVGNEELSPEELKRCTDLAGALARRGDRWLEIRPSDVDAAGRLLAAGAGEALPLREALGLAHSHDPHLPIVGLDATGWVADLLGASTDDHRMPRLEQPAGFRGTLRPYQRKGLSWLAFLDRFGLGACLADDMGLGKTIQLIALLLHERECSAADAPPGPTLLIVPTSLMNNWTRELARFAPELTHHVQHGPHRPQGDRFAEIAADRDVIITTYALVSRDHETLRRVAWHRLALDEAQFIKNPPTKQATVIRELPAARRLALTGTPVENRLMELWSIMQFCNPGFLGAKEEFRRRFAVPIERHRDARQAQRLRQLVGPFILRRLKTDPNVISDLPACVETKEYATLTAEQAALYQGIASAMLGEADRATGIRRRGVVLAALVRLKQLCNHPALLLREPVQQRPGAGTDAMAPPLSSRSGKTQRLIEMLEEVLATGDRALIFTQFRQMGHLLSAMIEHHFDCSVLFFHGGTPPPQRQQMIDRFQDARGTTPIFILSLKAGGIGLNLTAANHVFHFDRWWNPAVENQATDRAFRIGQKRTVHVHKFVCAGTLEEGIDQMIEEKAGLARDIIGSGEAWLTELSTSQLRDLLTLRDSAMEIDS